MINARIDHDFNHKIQMLLGQRAKMNGFTRAQRYIEPGACEWCTDHAGEIIPISQVISGSADHKNGKCFYRFLP